jgi:hypothetical protein
MRILVLGLAAALLASNAAALLARAAAAKVFVALPPDTLAMERLDVGGLSLIQPGEQMAAGCAADAEPLGARGFLAPPASCLPGVSGWLAGPIGDCGFLLGPAFCLLAPYQDQLSRTAAAMGLIFLRTQLRLPHAPLFGRFGAFLPVRRLVWPPALRCPDCVRHVPPPRTQTRN